VVLRVILKIGKKLVELKTAKDEDFKVWSGLKEGESTHRIN
jgi:hypothetical protein